MTSMFSHLPPDKVLRAVVSETEEALEVVQRMSGFLLDPSAGFLTKHQKEIAYTLYQNAQHLADVLTEARKYVSE
jgi:hypothetical protein